MSTPADNDLCNMNTTDLSNLPKTEKGYIKWKEAVNCKVKFNYNNVEGELIITNVIPGECGKHYHLEVEYNGLKYILPAESIRKCRLRQILGRKLGLFNCNIGDILELRHQKGQVIDQFRERDKSGGLHKMLKMRCCDCGREWSAQEQSLLKGGTKGIQGCPYCNWMGKFEEGFNDIPTTDPWMVPFFQGGEEEAK